MIHKIFPDFLFFSVLGILRRRKEEYRETIVNDSGETFRKFCTLSRNNIIIIFLQKLFDGNIDI